MDRKTNYLLDDRNGIDGKDLGLSQTIVLCHIAAGHSYSVVKLE